ncbi:MAG: DUF3293 domain-containing protein [Gemmatimonadaceae bacterium]
MRLDPERIEPDWGHYPNTILAFLANPAVRIDLRQVLRADALARLKEIGLGDSFAILTAFDPDGRDLSARENEQRQAELEARLAAGRYDFVRVEACSSDRSHCEHSVAVRMSQRSAVDLAREFGQVAIFWFDGKAFWIVGAIGKTDPLMLPRNA